MDSAAPVLLSQRGSSGSMSWSADTTINWGPTFILEDLSGGWIGRERGIRSFARRFGKRYSRLQQTGM